MHVQALLNSHAARSTFLPSSAEPHVLRAQLAAVLQQNASQSEVINQQSEEISRLQAKLESKDKQLAEALRLLFGSRSER